MSQGQKPITNFFPKMQNGFSFADLETKMKLSVDNSKKQIQPIASNSEIVSNPLKTQRAPVDDLAEKMKKTMEKTKLLSPCNLVTTAPEIPLTKKPKSIPTERVVEEIIIDPSPKKENLEITDLCSDDMFADNDDDHDMDSIPEKEFFEIESQSSKQFKSNLSVWLTNWEKHVSQTPCLAFVWASSGSGRTHYIRRVAKKMGFHLQFVDGNCTGLLNQILVPLARKAAKTLIVWKIQESIKTEPQWILGQKTPLKHLLKEEYFGTPKDFATGLKIMKRNEQGQCYLEDAPTKWPNPMIIITSDQYLPWVKDFHPRLVKDLKNNIFQTQHNNSNPFQSSVPPYTFHLTLPYPKELTQFASWHCARRNLKLETGGLNLLCRNSYGNIHSLLKLISMVAAKNKPFQPVQFAKISQDISLLNIHISFEEQSNQYSDESSKQHFVPLDMDQTGHSEIISSPNDLFNTLKKTNESFVQEIFGCWEAASSFDSKNWDCGSFSQRLVRAELINLNNNNTTNPKTQFTLCQNIYNHSQLLSTQNSLFSETQSWENGREKLHCLAVLSTHLLQASWTKIPSEARQCFIRGATWGIQASLTSCWNVFQRSQKHRWKTYYGDPIHTMRDAHYLYSWIGSLFSLQHEKIQLDHNTRSFVWTKHLWNAFMNFTIKTNLPSFLAIKAKGQVNNASYMAVKEKTFLLSNKIALFLYCMGISSNDILALMEHYEESKPEPFDIVLLNNLKQCNQLISMVSNFALGKAEPGFAMFEEFDFGHRCKSLVQTLKEELKALGVKKDDRQEMVTKSLEHRYERFVLLQDKPQTSSSIFEDQDDD